MFSLLKSSINPSLILSMPKRHATKKLGASKARQKKKPAGKRYGLKTYPGTQVEPGNILVKQRGTKNHPGQNVEIGRDFTLYAKEKGFVHLNKNPVTQNKELHVLPFPPKQTEEGLQSTLKEMKNAKPVMGVPSFLEIGHQTEQIYHRDYETNERKFSLIDLTKLSIGDPGELSTAEGFLPMRAYLRASGLEGKLPESGYITKNSEQ